MLIKRTVKVSFKLPAWQYCNLEEDTKQTCRFCAKTKTGNYCALYNMPLMAHGLVVEKTKDCLKGAWEVK